MKLGHCSGSTPWREKSEREEKKSERGEKKSERGREGGDRDMEREGDEN